MRFHSPVWTLLPSLTLSLHPEGADVRPVSLVIWRGPGQFQQHITRAGRFTELAHWTGAIRVGYLRTQRSKKTWGINDQKKLLRAYFSEPNLYGFLFARMRWYHKHQNTGVQFNILQYSKQGDILFCRPWFFAFLLAICACFFLSQFMLLRWKSQMAGDGLEHCYLAVWSLNITQNGPLPQIFACNY